jgi:prolyl 4-hydroxylase
MTTTPKALDSRLLAMLREHIRLGCDVAESLKMARGLGYPDDAIVAAFDAVQPSGDALADGVLRPPPLIERRPPNLRLLHGEKFELYALDDFLKPKDCAKVCALVAHHLRPSGLSYASSDAAFRTSSTAHLCHLRSPVASWIDEKICRTLGIRAEYSEGIQAQRYEVGQQFKPHWDYFIPDTESYARLAGLRGNRTWSFMVYLNDDVEGGATRFTKIDLAVRPKLGMALLWNNLTPDGTPNEATMHCGEPVERGHKIIITKWFRMLGDGPVFHDHAAQL